MSTPVKNAFITLCMNYTDNFQVAEKFWKEIEEHYTETSRYYHTQTEILVPPNQQMNQASKFQKAPFYWKPLPNRRCFQ